MCLSSGLESIGRTIGIGNSGSVLVLQYDSSQIKVFVRSKNTILKFVGNTK